MIVGKAITVAELELSGKKVLVTGASSGIGFRVASDFLKNGATVGAHYRNNKKGVSELLQHDPLGKCRIFKADFSCTEEITRLWEEFQNWSQGIDVLVYNAGAVTDPVDLQNLSEEAWDNTFQVNLKAPLFLSRSAMKVMSEQNSGRIINVSSIGVKFGGGSNTVHYSASKAALEALTLSLAKIGAPNNVLVNAIRAGVTDTNLHVKIGRSQMISRTSLIPLGRMAKASEISEVIMFLASKNSSYITGTIIPVAGGE